MVSYTPEASTNLTTRSVHGDDVIKCYADVAPAIHTSTTFRYSDDPDKLVVAGDEEESAFATNKAHVYSRVTAPNTTRLEAMLTSIIGAPVLTYSSGLAAFHAMLVQLKPRVIAINGGYHGCHGVIDIHKKLTGLRTVDLFDQNAWDEAGVGAGDLVHVETPVNPYGEARNLAQLAAQAHSRGAVVSVDATLGPPGLQDPFASGADIVMHSGTKYIGGHSDMLCGVLATRRQDWLHGLGGERVFLGSVMGSLEGWLGVRSVRTLELRVRTQSQNAENLVRWLDSALREAPDKNDEDRGADSGSDPMIRKLASRVQHASLQLDDMEWLQKQMPNGFGPVFALWMKTPEAARSLPSKLKLFHHATSLGGVESLIEWRRMSDNTVDPRLLRVSVGIESWQDLRDDLVQAFKALS